MVISSPAWVLTGVPARPTPSSTSDTANEATIATTSHQALMRHQNQRTR